MEQKTKITAEDDKQELVITREFDLPVALLFKAYTLPEIVEEWMGTKVLKLENNRHGSYAFETTDPLGNKHRFNGVIHEFSPNEKITRTFEIENSALAVQLEFFAFEPLTERTSRLTMHIIFKSVAFRDQMLKMGMPRGISMAHDRLQVAAQKFN